MFWIYFGFLDSKIVQHSFLFSKFSYLHYYAHLYPNQICVCCVYGWGSLGLANKNTECSFKSESITNIDNNFSV